MAPRSMSAGLYVSPLCGLIMTTTTTTTTTSLAYTR